MKTFLYLPVLLLLFLCLEGNAQQPASLVYGGFSMNQYRGDLSTPNVKYTGSLALGLQLNRKKRLNGSFGISYGKITGQNSLYEFKANENATPNRFFSSSIVSLQYDLHYNILKKERYILYLSQGFGILRYNPEDDRDRNLLDRFETRAPNEIYSNTSVMLPSSLGLIYFLPNQWGLGLQAGYLNPLTDYLDNIGQWGTKSGNDNVLKFRFALYVPMKARESLTTDK